MIRKQSGTYKQLLHDIKYNFGDTLMETMANPNVTDIMLNPNGEVWVKEREKEAYFLTDFSAAKAESIVRIIYTYQELNILDQAYIEGKLPINGARFTALIPPLVENVSFTIRMPAIKVYNLDDYITQGIITDAQKQAIQKGLDEQKNILICGGTGTGKTTLLNAMLAYITQQKPTQRFLVLQDTPEIQVNAKNAVLMTTNEHTDLDTLLKLALRMYPKRIIVGEVRGSEAYQLLKAWNTGHPGGISTIHANSCQEALYRLEQLVGEATHLPQMNLIASTVQMLVFMCDTEQGLKVEEVKHVVFDEGAHRLLE